LRRQRSALLITVAVFIAAFIAGYILGQIPRWQLPLLSSQDAFINQANKVPEFLTVSFQKEAMFFILWQNMRVLLGVLLLSMFTFGAASLVITPATFAIMGYLFSQVALAGYGLDFLLGAVLTHGIIEIPVIVMATAACLSLGAVATRPPRGTTVGHAWIMALADTIKLAVGIIVPGLIVAAFIEAFITPHVVLALLG
jgi:stage II sporulation protein M